MFFNFLGPAKWGDLGFPDAKGNRQSPIDISTKIAKFDSSLQTTPLTVNYVGESGLSIENCGFSFKVNMSKQSGKSHNYKNVVYKNIISQHEPKSRNHQVFFPEICVFSFCLPTGLQECVELLLLLA